MPSARCACGAVTLTLHGAPIGSFACYCDTCQEGSARIEALPHAPPVRESDGGTAYVVYRKDRVEIADGADRLTSQTLERSPKTKRSVATCCSAAMMMSFDDARHWISVYRARLGSSAPPIEMRICTGDLSAHTVLPNDLPAHRSYAPAMLLRLLASRLAMFFGR